MRLDLYTKGVLTVIAGCLIYLCFGRPPLMMAAQAQNQPTRVVLVGWSWPDSSHVNELAQKTGEGLPVTPYERR